MAQQKTTVVKQIIKTSDLQHMTPNKFNSLGIINFPNPLNKDEMLMGDFQIFDGVAFGTVKVNGEEREVIAQYPLLNLVNKTATNMKENIRTHLNIEEDRDVTVFEILASYAVFKFINN